MQIPIPECFDSPEDALKAAVMAMGGFKEVGRKMRPDFQHSGEWLRKCLSDDRRERLDPGQTLWILREAHAVGFHAAMDYFAGDAGYKAEPINLEAQAQSLQESINNGMQSLQATMAKLVALQAKVAQR